MNAINHSLYLDEANEKGQRPANDAATDASHDTGHDAAATTAADTATNADERWAAVLRRDPAYDGEFVYAVRSTRVYCRPSCPSRVALRRNVEFFETTILANRAGYRPCRRCKPGQVSLAQQHRDRVLQACRTMEQSTEPVALETLARAAGLSQYYFHRVFKQIAGLTPKAYFQAVQARRFRAALPVARSVTEAIYDAGYNSSGRFYDKGAAALGMAPAAYREGGAGEQIHYAVDRCALGLVIVGATARGVCAVEFGDSTDRLEDGLRTRFPKASLVPDDGRLQSWVAQILNHIKQPAGVLDLPLDIQGTVFQRRVWQALQDIPAGSTASYAQVAVAIGQPGAARAVARACASNPLAVVVPCHRVVRGDGQVSAYRWGLARKVQLLKHEAGQ